MSGSKNSKEDIRPFGSILFSWLEHRSSARFIIGVLAEWLRRCTQVALENIRVGSNPTDTTFLLLI